MAYKAHTDELHDITLELGGQKIGSIKEWRPGPDAPIKIPELKVPELTMVSAGRRTFDLTLQRSWLSEQQWTQPALPTAMEFRGSEEQQQHFLLCLRRWGVEPGMPVSVDLLSRVVRKALDLGLSLEFDSEYSSRTTMQAFPLEFDIPI